MFVVNAAGTRVPTVAHAAETVAVSMENWSAVWWSILVALLVSLQDAVLSYHIQTKLHIK